MHSSWKKLMRNSKNFQYRLSPTVFLSPIKPSNIKIKLDDDDDHGCGQQIFRSFLPKAFFSHQQNINICDEMKKFFEFTNKFIQMNCWPVHTHTETLTVSNVFFMIIWPLWSISYWIHWTTYINADQMIKMTLVITSFSDCLFPILFFFFCSCYSCCHFFRSLI